MEQTFHPLYVLCFVQACDGWRAWRHTPAVLIRHHIITKGLADWDDLLHPLGCRCQTPSFSKDNSVTSSLPLQNKPTLMKDCRVSIKKVQIHCCWHQLESCTLSYSCMSITLRRQEKCARNLQSCMTCLLLVTENNTHICSCRKTAKIFNWSKCSIFLLQ